MQYVPYDSYEDGRFLLGVFEGDQGRDLDADGDLDDTLLVMVFEGIELPFQTGVQFFNFARVGDLVAVNQHEVAIGLDLNGDGDTNDPVMFGWNPIDNRLIATGWAGLYATHGRGEQFLFLTNEGAQRVDLNGDGDEKDAQLILHDAQGTVARFDIWSDGAYIAPNGSILAVGVEAYMERDLNGDGDALDRVFQVLGAGTSGR